VNVTEQTLHRDQRYGAWDEHEMGANGEGEISVENLRERNHFEGLCLDMRILKWTLREIRCKSTDWTELSQDLCKVGDEPSGSVTSVKHLTN
jgi:hypothetical protein